MTVERVTRMADDLGWTVGRKVTVIYLNGDVQAGVFASPALIVGPDFQPFAVVLTIHPKRRSWKPPNPDGNPAWTNTVVEDLPTYELTILVAAIRSFRLEPEPTDPEGDPDA